MLGDKIKKYVISCGCMLWIRYKFNSYSKERKKYKIVNALGTVKYIDRNKCSVSRYGDGELNMVFQFLYGKNVVGESFQDYDERLAERLVEILQNNRYNNDKHIVCIPYWLLNTSVYKNSVRYYCESYYCTHRYGFLHAINCERLYFDTNISRFYLSFKNKKHCKLYIEQLKKIWAGRNICFVEGSHTRLGIGNDLFKSALSITRILCPAVNAFTNYDLILKTAMERPKNTLFLIALGHTATVLAYDLSNVGYQAIDIGHIDVEYEWMLMGAKTKVSLKNKYVNEVESGHINTECDDIEYASQIIARIK